jgi:hypothetical protein
VKRENLGILVLKDQLDLWAPLVFMGHQVKLAQWVRLGLQAPLDLREFQENRGSLDLKDLLVLKGPLALREFKD